MALWQSVFYLSKLSKLREPMWEKNIDEKINGLLLHVNFRKLIKT